MSFFEHTHITQKTGSEHETSLAAVARSKILSECKVLVR